MNTNDFDVLMYDQAFYNLIYTKYIFIQKKKRLSITQQAFSLLKEKTNS